MKKYFEELSDSRQPGKIKYNEVIICEIKLCFLSSIWSGKELTLLPIPPLRTVRESFPSYGSSLS